MCRPCQTSMMPAVGFTRGGGVHPCHFGLYSSTCKALELLGNDRVALAQPLVRIPASCKAALKRVFQGKDACRMSSHAKPLLKRLLAAPAGGEGTLGGGGRA